LNDALKDSKSNIRYMIKGYYTSKKQKTMKFVIIIMSGAGNRYEVSMTDSSNGINSVTGQDNDKNTKFDVSIEEYEEFINKVLNREDVNWKIIVSNKTKTLPGTWTTFDPEDDDTIIDIKNTDTIDSKIAFTISSSMEDINNKRFYYKHDINTKRYNYYTKDEKFVIYFDTNTQKWTLAKQNDEKNKYIPLLQSKTCDGDEVISCRNSWIDAASNSNVDLIIEPSKITSKRIELQKSEIDRVVKENEIKAHQDEDDKTTQENIKLFKKMSDTISLNKIMLSTCLNDFTSLDILLQYLDTYDVTKIKKIISDTELFDVARSSKKKLFEIPDYNLSTPLSPLFIDLFSDMLHSNIEQLEKILKFGNPTISAMVRNIRRSFENLNMSSSNFNNIAILRAQLNSVVLRLKSEDIVSSNLGVDTTDPTFYHPEGEGSKLVKTGSIVYTLNPGVKIKFKIIELTRRTPLE